MSVILYHLSWCLLCIQGAVTEVVTTLFSAQCQLLFKLVLQHWAEPQHSFSHCEYQSR